MTEESLSKPINLAEDYTPISQENICDVLRDLVPFEQFKKCENTHAGALILVKLTLLHGCFSRF